MDDLEVKISIWIIDFNMDWLEIKSVVERAELEFLAESMHKNRH